MRKEIWFLGGSTYTYKQQTLLIEEEIQTSNKESEEEW